MKGEPIGRLRYLRCSAEWIIRMCRNDCIHDKVLTPLPADTKYIRGGTDALGNIFMVIESKEFEELGEHDEIPYYGDLTFQRPSYGSRH